MNILLSGQQAVITFDLLRRYMAVRDLGKGELKTENEDTRIEWAGDTVEVKIPDEDVVHD